MTVDSSQSRDAGRESLALGPKRLTRVFGLLNGWLCKLCKLCKLRKTTRFLPKQPARQRFQICVSLLAEVIERCRTMRGVRRSCEAEQSYLEITGSRVVWKARQGRAGTPPQAQDLLGATAANRR